MYGISPQLGSPVTTDPSRWNMDTTGYSDILKMWNDAKFNPASIKWINYYPNEHFEKLLEENIKNFLGLSEVHRSWVSRIDPGYYAPLHWDVDDNEHTYLTKGTIKRFTVIINPMQLGQLFILGNQYIHSLEQGTILEWNNYKEWHAGINASMEPAYMFHLLAF
jgi:hypothetical protein